MLNDALDDLLLLNQEGTEDARADTGVASATTVGTADGAFVLPQTGHLAVPEGGNAVQGLLAVSALGGSSDLGSVEVDKTTTGGLADANLVATGVVGETASVVKALRL